MTVGLSGTIRDVLRLNKGLNWYFDLKPPLGVILSEFLAEAYLAEKQDDGATSDGEDLS